MNGISEVSNNKPKFVRVLYGLDKSSLISWLLGIEL